MKDKLKDSQIKAAKATTKPIKLGDGDGLYLLVNPNDNKLWRFRYHFDGKENTLALGVYPRISLKDARELREHYKTLLAHKQNPINHHNQRTNKDAQQLVTFEYKAREWWETQKNQWSKAHAEDVIRSLENDVFPSLGHVSVYEISASKLKSVLKIIEDRGALETLGRIRQRCEAIFDFAFFDDEGKTNPAKALKKHLKKPIPKRLPALTNDELPEFFEKIHLFNATIQTRLAIQLLALTFVRTNELIGAQWSEFDFKERLWTIPAERMKGRITTKRTHIVPLCDQAMKVLQHLHHVTGHTPFLFPKRSSIKEPMSSVSILRVIERIGYQGRMCGHGFRSTASTILNESGLFRHDVIEKQLGHSDKDKVRAAYNRADYLQERRDMMIWWGNFLESKQFKPFIIDKASIEQWLPQTVTS